MYYKVVQNCILNNFHYHHIQFFRDFLKTWALAVNFYFFWEKKWNTDKKIKVHRKWSCLKKISEKLYIMIMKVVENAILNNFVIHYVVFLLTFLKRSSILIKMTRFLKQTAILEYDISICISSNRSYVRMCFQRKCTTQW